MSKVPARVHPKLLRWARESAGLQLEEAAKKVAVTTARLSDWESAASSPTVKQLRKLAKAYHRPLSVFYLPEPPRDFQAMHDFRRLPGVVAGLQSVQLRYEIRRAHNRRDLALELLTSLGTKVTEFALRASLDEDPEVVAARIRKRLGLTVDDQKRWRTPYEALENWKRALEENGILVLQMISVAPKESRGISISASRLPAIVMNIKDPPGARCFTLFHELTHVLLRKGGLCDFDDSSVRPPEDLRAEVFANHVAGATLMPRDAVLTEPVVSKSQPESWRDEEIASLASSFGVSREALLRRLLVLGKTTSRFYKKKRDEYQRQYEEGRKERKGFVPPYRIALGSAGRLLTRAVLSSYHQESITASDVADILEIRLKHLEKIEAEAFREKATVA